LLALQLRGLNYELRAEEEEVSTALLARVDTTWSLAAGLAIIDISRAMNFALMGLRTALKAGDPERLLNAILMTCWIPVMTRIGGRPMADRLLDIATELAALIDTPKAQAVLEQAKATVCNGSSEWENTLLHLENAERIYRNHCTGVSWELATANTLYLYTKYMVGDFVEMGRRAEATIKDASETGDLYSSTIAETFPAPLWHLALDNPAEARRRAKNGLASWSTQGYDVQNAMGWMASGYIDFYEGQPVRFLSSVDKEWQLMCQYGFAQHPAMRGPVLNFWVRSLLAKAALPETTASQRRKLWDQAERKLKMLKESPGDFSAAMYPSTLGEMAEARGDREAALLAFAESEKRYARLAMKAYAVAVQRKRGLVMGVRAGDSLVLDAEEKLRSYGVSKPSRFAGMLVGGRQPKP
jgi:eukaryotic-like serine/threonine-protein kinase